MRIQIQISVLLFQTCLVFKPIDKLIKKSALVNEKLNFQENTKLQIKYIFAMDNILNF